MEGGDILAFHKKGFDLSNVNLLNLGVDHVDIFEKIIVENTIFKNEDLENTKLVDLWSAYTEVYIKTFSYPEGMIIPLGKHATAPKLTMEAL